MGISDSQDKITGPSIGAIGDGIGSVAAAFGRLITVMSAKDVAHAINIGFGAVSGTIGAITGTVKFLMNQWDSSSARIARDARDVATAFDSVRHGFAGIGHDVASAFDGIRHFNAAAFGGMISFFAGLPGKIKGFFAGAGAWPPPSRAAGHGYGGGGYVYNIHISGVAADPNAAARQVVAVLRAYKQRGGGAPRGIA